MDHFAFLLPVIFATFGITFLVVARYGTVSARFWGLGYLAAAAAFLMPIMPDIVPVRARALAADTLFLTGLTLIGQALGLHFHRTLPVLPRLALYMAGIAAALVSILILDDPVIDAMSNDLFALLCLGLPLLLLRGLAETPADRLLYGFAAAVALENLVRNLVIAGLRADPVAFDGFLASSYAFLMQANSAVLGLLMALSALAAVTLRTLGAYRDAAERDPLTGLLNRRGFERLAKAASVQSGGASGAVLACDLDHFKRINDRFGHMIGDRVITEFAALLEGTLPREAISARFGGEEFVCYLPATTLDEAAKIAERARQIFERDTDLSAIGERVTASFGLAECRGEEASYHPAYGRADRALYAAKANGRNQVARADRLPPSRLAATSSLRAFSRESASHIRLN